MTKKRMNLKQKIEKYIIWLLSFDMIIRIELGKMIKKLIIKPFSIKIM